MKSIKKIPVALRPREKLLKYGPEVLNTSELVATIFITGSRKHSVLKLAQRTARLFKSGVRISKGKLLEVGLGKTKVAQIIACIELMKRLNMKEKKLAKTAKDIVQMSQDIVNSEKENLICFYINARGEVVRREIVAIGKVNMAAALPSEIFSLIKELPVAGIILVHNHPSGDVEASVEDVRFTKRISLAGEIVGVKLLDHIIVASGGWKRIEI